MQTRYRQQGNMKLIIIGAVLVMILVTGGVIAALYVTGALGGGDDAEMVAEGEMAVEEEKPKEPPKPPIYIPMEPALVVNFDRNGRIGYLQATVQVMTRDPAVADALQQHMPVMRNNLLLLLGDQSYETMSTRDGKERLRKAALAELNKVLEKQGVEGRLEELYFTGFVMQ